MLNFLRHYAILLSCLSLLGAGPVDRLLKAKTDPALARAIYEIETHKLKLGDLREGLNDTRVINLKGLWAPIPVREVVGTIIHDVLGEHLDRNFMEQGKQYAVREILSFQNKRNGSVRFHIVVFNDKQYDMMRALLNDMLLSKSNKAIRPTA